MTFLDVFEGVEYESAIIPKLSFLKGVGGGKRGRVSESPTRNIPPQLLLMGRPKPAG